MMNIFSKPCLIILLIVVLLFPGCATAPVTPDAGARKDSGKIFLQDVCAEYGVRWDLDSISQVITLTKGAYEAKALVGSAMVLMGTDRIQLNKPLVRSQGAIVVPKDFVENVLSRFDISPEVVSSPTKKYKVVIDAGHGGKDPGAIGTSGTYEKTVVLDIAKRIQSRLTRKGVDVVMTRDTDRFLTLEKRTEIAAQENADLFISVHANSNPSRNVQGIEVYSLRQLTAAEITEDQRIKNYNIVFSKFSMREDDDALRRILADMLFNYKNSESPVLAAHLISEAAHATRVNNRGLKKAGFFVLRNTLIPAVLVEVGFLSNATEERRLKSAEFQENIAESLTRGILVYLSRSQ